MKAFVIEKNIPIPAAYDRVHKWPFANMEVGDSFLVDFSEATRRKLCTASSYYGKRRGKKFSIRKLDNGIRVWRVE